MLSQLLIKCSSVFHVGWNVDLFFFRYDHWWEFGIHVLQDQMCNWQRAEEDSVGVYWGPMTLVEPCQCHRDSSVKTSTWTSGLDGGVALGDNDLEVPSVVIHSTCFQRWCSYAQTFVSKTRITSPDSTVDVDHVNNAKLVQKYLALLR